MIAGVWAYLTDAAHWSGADGILALLVQHALLTLASVLIAVVVGLPLALWMGHTGKGGLVAINVSNIGRAVPIIALLALLSMGWLGTGDLGPFGRAGLATLVTLALFALPPIITTTWTGMREVDAETVEAARGMGMTETEVVRRVELPLAMPMIVSGIRLAVVQVWATATIAALVAGPGLGRIITHGYAAQDGNEVVAGALIVAVVALTLEGVLSVLQRRLDPVSRARQRSNRPIPA